MEELLDLDNTKSSLRVYVAYTGGTMGMKVNAEGNLAPEVGYLTAQLRLMMEKEALGIPQFDVHEYAPLLDSSDMGPSEWLKIAKDIESNYFNYDGFVVVMGTDTMAYCASALSFMFENLGKTVVITGSMIPFANVYNDARRNFVVSLLLAAVSDIPEVCIFFNDQLLRGNRTKKLAATSLTAFGSPNHPPLAQLGVRVTLNKNLILAQPRGRFRVHEKLETNIVVLKYIPGFEDATILAVLSNPNVRGIIFEFFGTGNAPKAKGDLLEGIVSAVKNGVIVCAASQCPIGYVELEMYAVGASLANAGVVSVRDMTTEAAATKLAYLMGKGYSHSEVISLMSQNLRGELTPSPTLHRL